MFSRPASSGWVGISTVPSPSKSRLTRLGTLRSEALYSSSLVICEAGTICWLSSSNRSSTEARLLPEMPVQPSSTR